MAMVIEEHAGVTCISTAHLWSHKTLKRVDRQTKKTDAVTTPTKLLTTQTATNANKINHHKTNSQQNKQLN